MDIDSDIRWLWTKWAQSLLSIHLPDLHFSRDLHLIRSGGIDQLLLGLIGRLGASWIQTLNPGRESGETGLVRYSNFSIKLPSMLSRDCVSS